MLIAPFITLIHPRVVAVVIQRQHHLLELVVKRACIVVGQPDRVPDRPAGHAFDAPLDPPAVEHRQIGHAVERGFHAAGAGSLERRQRRVEPHVHTGSQHLCQRHVVFGQVDDRDRTGKVARMRMQLLDQLLAAVVVRMRLAARARSGTGACARSPSAVRGR